MDMRFYQSLFDLIDSYKELYVDAQIKIERQKSRENIIKQTEDNEKQTLQKNIELLTDRIEELENIIDKEKKERKIIEQDYLELEDQIIEASFIQSEMELIKKDNEKLKKDLGWFKSHYDCLTS